MKIRKLKINFKRIVATLLTGYILMTPLMSKGEKSSNSLLANIPAVSEEFSFESIVDYGVLGPIFPYMVDECFENYRGRYERNNKHNSFAQLVDGKIGTYYPNGGWFSYDNERIKCDLYVSNNESLNEVENIILLIGGTGNRLKGIDPSGVRVGEHTLVISVCTGDANVNLIDKSEILKACVLFMNNMVNSDNRYIHNSVVGISEGAQTAFVLISKCNIFKTFVCCNGAAYSTRDGNNLIKTYGSGSYRNFKDLDLIFLESANNNNWNYYIVQTILDMDSKNVPLSNIYFYTNDSDLCHGKNKVYYNDDAYPSVKNLLKNEGYFYFLDDSEAKMYGGWSKHGDGNNMVLDSNILQYISSNQYYSKYQDNNVSKNIKSK